MTLKKETMMGEVVKIARATITVHSLLQAHFCRPPPIPERLRRAHRLYPPPRPKFVQPSAVSIISANWRYFVQRRKWIRVCDDKKRFGNAKPLGEAYARGFAQRWAFRLVKEAAIADGRWNSGSGLGSYSVCHRYD